MQGVGTIAQMNVRLDRGLKAAGDAVLAEVGITPTELIRELWEKVSRGSAHAMQVREFLRDKACEGVGTGCTPAQEQKMEALVRGRRLFGEGLDAMGIQAVTSPAGMGAADIDLYAEALVGRMRERGTW